MQKWVGVVLVLLVMLIGVPLSLAATVDLEVIEQFDEQEEISVIVVLEDDYSNVPAQRSARSLIQDDLALKKKMIDTQQEKVKDLLEERSEIVQVSETLESNDNETGQSVLTEDESAIEPKGTIEIEGEFSLVNGLVATIDEEGLERLRQTPGVKHVYPNREYKALLSDVKTVVNATKTWQLIYSTINLTGQHQTICVIDTGVDYTHPDMGACTATSNLNDRSCSKVIGGYDFINSDNNPIDDNGHGTHVAGIVASTNQTYRGIAPDARIAAVKSLNSGGSGTSQNVIDGINWCSDNAAALNITVISMSLGTEATFSNYCDADDPLTAAAINTAVGRNITVVSATGNDGDTSGISAPACIKNATAIGSTTKADAVSGFTNSNQLMDLLAPGSSITSLKATGTSLSGCSAVDSNKLTCSGTSMATPAAAGAFALLNQYFTLKGNSSKTQDAMLGIFNATGKRITDGGNGLTFSRINIFGAIRSQDSSALNVSFIAPTPSNNTITSNNSLIINITSSRTLLNALVDFNGTNFSMNGGGVTWSRSFSGISNQNATYTYKVWGNDSFGNIAQSPFRIFVSNNTPPSITAIQPAASSSIPENNENFIFNMTLSDAQNDPLSVSWRRNNTIVATTANFSMPNNFSNAGSYNISASITDGNFTIQQDWTLTITNNNRIPNVTSINLTSSDGSNDTRTSLIGLWTINDQDGDAILSNETRWYRNNQEMILLRNMTTITEGNTSKGENWTFSASVYDGNWSEFRNSSILRIQNSIPRSNVTFLTDSASETQPIILNITFWDYDNDTILINMTNDNFTRQSTSNITPNGYPFFSSSFIWFTNLSSAGEYSSIWGARDAETPAVYEMDEITFSVINARDLDNDGNPDFNETDDDNDGLNDEADYLVGNLSHLNTTLNLNISLNGSANYSRMYNGTYIINISNGSSSLIVFNFTFNQNYSLDFSNITINRSTNGNGALSVRGLGDSGYTKTFYIEKLNSTVDAVCIKDQDIGYDTISTNCTGSNEILVRCNNQSTSTGLSISSFGIMSGGGGGGGGSSNRSYTCNNAGTRYEILGLNHSAVKELCKDNDGDGYGIGCSLGTDECDSNSAQHTSSGCNPSPSPSPSPSGGGGGGGGGGGATLLPGIRASKLFNTVEPGIAANYTINKKGMPINVINFIPSIKEIQVTVSLKVIEKNSTSHINTNEVYHYIDISIDKLDESELIEATITFEVNQSWLHDHDLIPTSVQLERYDEGWQQLNTQMIWKNESTIRYSASTPGFSLFAITAQKTMEETALPNTQPSEQPQEAESVPIVRTETQEQQPSKENNSRQGTWIPALLVLALIVIIVAILLFVQPKETREEDPTLHKALHTVHHKVHSSVRKKKGEAEFP